jgi:sulfite oxidase
MVAFVNYRGTAGAAASGATSRPLRRAGRLQATPGPREEASSGMTSPTQRLVRDPEGLNTAIWPVPIDRLVTPTDLFFTRSHAPIPVIDRRAWRLQVDGLVERPATFTFDELLAAFPRREIAATLICAGLRRDEYLAIGPLPGELPWGSEPVSTGRWAGVALGDLLRAAGVRDRARHVELTGLDSVERHGQRFGFGGSIDLAKALGTEVLLASELNGAPLPEVHGFPLRAVVPGWIGARSVKWLGRITLREDPSPNYFQAKAYRVQSETNPRDPRDVSAGEALRGVPLNAVIADPVADQTVAAGLVRVRGWAMGAEGRRLATVEVSPTGGRDWVPARVAHEAEPWTWALWEATLELGPGPHVLAARATDCAGASQPAAVGDTWNVKGYANNAWHRVVIRAE